MYRNFRLVLLTAAAVLLLAAPARAQHAHLNLAGLPAADVPARLVAARAELMLSSEQVRSLQALSDELAREAALHRVSSKPWVTAIRLTSPAEAYDRAVAALNTEQRSHAAALLERPEGAA
ncbi:MAG: hypothetical protein ACREOC_12435 [Gemmatimonadales bacterium]